jgi:hypothetical protein
MAKLRDTHIIEIFHLNPGFKTLQPGFSEHFTTGNRMEGQVGPGKRLRPTNCRFGVW